MLSAVATVTVGLEVRENLADSRNKVFSKISSSECRTDKYGCPKTMVSATREKNPLLKAPNDQYRPKLWTL
jgi:hypothetical protein